MKEKALARPQPTFGLGVVKMGMGEWVGGEKGACIVAGV